MPTLTTWTLIRRIAVIIVGGVLLIAGILMLVLPGPAFIVIPLGLGVLATEFPWARRWAQKLRRAAADKFEKLSRER